MTHDQFKRAEECLYCYKYLTGRIARLEMEQDDIMPPSPGSVLKMVGRPVAKAPGDPSQTETWGILRATSRQAREITAKRQLQDIVRQLKNDLPIRDSEFIRLKYDKELPARSVMRELGIKKRAYHYLRERVLKRLWQRVSKIDVDIAVN